MKIGVIANPEKYALSEALNTLHSWALGKKHLLLLQGKLAEKSRENHCFEVLESEEDVVDQSDILISLGGDGTILWTARLIGDRGIPILGINIGRLGFLANTQVSDLIKALDLVSEGNYDLDARNLLQAKTSDGQLFYALNEVLFTRRDTSSMIVIEATAGSTVINRYWADGLLVSTPTGSTAYNLSAGGPILDPQTPVFVLTPISPHTLTTRPVVLSSKRPIRISVPAQENEVLFAVDGASHIITQYPFDIEIQQSDFAMNLIRLPGHDFFETLRNKLMWGRDYREK